MVKNEAALHRGNDNSANVHRLRDMSIIPSDLALAACGAALWLGVPFVLALLKQMGAW